MKAAPKQKFQSAASSGRKTRREGVRTAGEVFEDGSMIEPVCSGDQGLELLLWKNQQISVALQIDHHGRRYLPPELTPSLRRIMRFPRSATRFGSSSELLGNVSQLFKTYVGFSEAQIPLATAWVFSTWFPECWSRAPELVITGWNMDTAMVLFRLLACLTRHPLMLAGIQRATLGFLPMHVNPTLLINQPDISPRILEFWQTANYRDVVVPGPRGDVRAIAGSKAVFLATSGSGYGGFPFRICLPAAQSRSSLLTDFAACHIAEEFQPKLLMYRLRHFRRVRDAQTSPTTSRLPGAHLAPLSACIQDDDKFQSRVGAIVADEEQEVRAERSRKPEIAIVEVLWAPSHSSKEVKVKEITRLMNTLIWTRGEKLEYGEIEIGQILASCGLPRHRNGAGMVLRFSREISRRLHELAIEFGLTAEHKPGCEFCAGFQAADKVV